MVSGDFISRCDTNVQIKHPRLRRQRTSSKKEKIKDEHKKHPEREVRAQQAAFQPIEWRSDCFSQSGDRKTFGTRRRVRAWTSPSKLLSFKPSTRTNKRFKKGLKSEKQMLPSDTEKNVREGLNRRRSSRRQRTEPGWCLTGTRPSLRGQKQNGTLVFVHQWKHLDLLSNLRSIQRRNVLLR